MEVQFKLSYLVNSILNRGIDEVYMTYIDVFRSF